VSASPEFSRPVALSRLGAEPFRQEIAATAADREALARRFGLVALDRLSAIVELSRQGDGTILLEASFEAAFAQECVVTLEPVPGMLSEHFSLRYGAPDAEDDAVAEAGLDEPAFEPLDGETIDIGEAVAQEFSLALPPFPRDPAAVVETLPEPPGEPGAFAALQRLQRGD
jgi:uncharacterized metal-binding protein YceD (DUF177 family)